MNSCTETHSFVFCKLWSIGQIYRSVWIYKKMTLCLATFQMCWVPAVLVARPSGYLAAHNQPHKKNHNQPHNKFGFCQIFITLSEIVLNYHESEVKSQNICILREKMKLIQKSSVKNSLFQTWSQPLWLHIRNNWQLQYPSHPYLIFVIFSPRSLIVAKIFSTQKRVNCDKPIFRKTA